jgi:HSP20 family protein
MANLTRWNPLREMAAMQNAMDRFFDENWRPFFEEGHMGMHPLALDMHENDTNYVVTTEMPGVQPDNIQVRVENDILTIEGEIPEQVSEQKEGDRVIMKERRYGKFSRRIRLPQMVDADKVEASYQDGVLKLTLPKSESAQPKRIQVKTGNGKQ